MIRRWVYLTLIFACFFFTSLSIQTQINKPERAVSVASQYREVRVDLTVTKQVGGRWSVKVTGGDLPAGSVGLIATKGEKFLLGDHFKARLRLSRAVGFSRYAFQAKLLEVEGSVHHQPTLGLVNNLRSFASQFHGDSLNLVSGLAVGIDSGLSKEFVASMKTTGLTHLTAVSGANCAIVLGAVWLILRRFRLGRGTRFVCSVFVLVGYVVLVGFQPSVLRAAFMMSVVLLALELGRRIWITGALMLGSSLLLLLDPWLIADYGFWLSVLATFGLVVLTPNLAARLQEHFPKPIAIGLSATFAAQLWCLPLLLQLQGGFTTYSVLANLLVEPMVPIITLLGLLGTIFGVIWAPLGSLLFSIASIPAGWIVWVANSLSQAPNSLLSIQFGVVGFVLAVVLVLAVSWLIVKRSFLALSVVVAFGLLGLGTVLMNLVKPWPISDWDVVGCDVGQGDSLVIRSWGEVAVIDTGKDPGLIDGCLDRLQVKQVDLLVLTHFDFDHVGGLTGLERGRTIKLALISPFPDDRPEANFMRDNLATFASEVVKPSVGFSGKLGDFDWQVFSSLGSAAKTANQGSLGIRFESNTELIYTLADLDEDAQCRALNWAHSSSKLTIVKVSHHGSADQCEEFYQAIQPDVALISVGKGNAYGHPTNRALEILAKTGAKVFRTDTQGAISLKSVSGGVQVLVAGSR